MCSKTAGGILWKGRERCKRIRDVMQAGMREKSWAAGPGRGVSMGEGEEFLLRER